MGDGISYIHTGQGVLYLSMFRDLYDNSIVSYKTGTEQTVNLVLKTIHAAMREETVAAELQLHSDQGFQYTSRAYFNLIKEYGIMPSMSRRGNCYDNAMAEAFSESSKQSVFTGINSEPLKKPGNSSMNT